MTITADVHDTRALRGLEQLRDDEVREEEVADMVRPELHLETFRGLRVGRGHDAGVVDEDVYRARP